MAVWKILAKCLMVVVGIAAISAMADGVNKLVIPRGTSLEVSDNSTLWVAKFKGEEWVSGTMHAEWGDEAQETDPDTDYYLMLVPDSPGMKGLPHFKNNVAPYIEFSDTRDALRMVFGTQTAEKLSRHEINNIRIHGRFLITAFILDSECETNFALAKLVSVDISQKVALTGDAVATGC